MRGLKKNEKHFLIDQDLMKSSASTDVWSIAIDLEEKRGTLPHRPRSTAVISQYFCMEQRCGP